MRYEREDLPDGSVMINGFRFPPGTTIPAATGRTGLKDGLSNDRVRTLRRAAEIESGRHPMGGRLREPRGETCGSCKHCVAIEYAGRFYKCDRMRAQWTKGPGTDLRLKWPACEQWEKEETNGI